MNEHRLKHSGNTPEQEAVSVAMEAVHRAMTSLGDFIDDNDLPLHARQNYLISAELAAIHNRIGKRFKGDWHEVSVGAYHPNSWRTV